MSKGGPFKSTGMKGHPTPSGSKPNAMTQATIKL